MIKRSFCAIFFLALIGTALSVTYADDRALVVVCPPTTAARLRTFQDYGASPFFLAEEHALSTFALDVDRASFDVAELWLANGERPERGAVRPEEFVNALPYAYPAPAAGIALHMDGVPQHPFAADENLGLLRVTMQAAALAERPHLSLVILLDRSGSMRETSGPPGLKQVKWDMVRDLIQQLTDALHAEDRIGLVSYAYEASLDRPLAPPAAPAGFALMSADPILSEPHSMRAALNSLEAEGGTNLFEGFQLAYELAGEEKARWPERNVAILLFSDGAANVGVVDYDEMLERTEQYRAQGIRLSTIGVGFTTLNDVILEQLGDQGDGQYVFYGLTDSKARVLAAIMSHLHPVAREARSQLEFMPGAIAAWRQVGFENRSLRDEAYADDDVDAGEVGSGQSVTALYEVEWQADGLRGRDAAQGADQIVATAKLRWMAPDGNWIERSVALTRGEVQAGAMDARFRAAALMARWAQLMRRDHAVTASQLDAYEQLAAFALLINPTDPALADLQVQIDEVRNLIAIDMGLETLIDLRVQLEAQAEAVRNANAANVARLEETHRRIAQDLGADTN